MNFFPHKFRRKNLELLEIIQRLLSEQYKDLLPLTLRQIFYIVISQPNPLLQNTQGDYNRVSRVLKYARYSGQIPFEWIEDRTRHTSNLPYSLEELIDSYYPEAWIHQPYYFEVFVEKEALRSLFDRTLRPYYVRINVGRGYDSLSDVMDIAKRFYEYKDKPRFLFVFSDFDPSGDNIAEDITFRLGKCLIMLGEEPTYFSEKEKKVKIPNLSVHKVALTEVQVSENNLPPMDVKPKDPRASTFIEKYGSGAVVELDAMPPRALSGIVTGLCNGHLGLDEVERIRQGELGIKAMSLEAIKSIET
jgi:5S rRNA maturation endonuclease (ribonuclease M5)